MNKFKMIAFSHFVLFILVFVNIVQAQYIIDQIEYALKSVYGLVPDDMEFDNQIDEAKYFLNIPETTLNEYIKNNDAEAEINKSTIYIEGNKVAVENHSAEEGKTKAIFDYSKELFYYVIWSQKKVLEMSLDDLKQIQEESASAREKMLKNLSPEARAQLEQQMPNNTRSIGQKISATGKKAEKYGFDCNQYVSEGENKLTVVWAAEDIFGISNSIKRLTEKISSLFPSEEEEEIDEWELIPGKIPVEVRTIRFDMMNEVELEINAITKIEKSLPPAHAFSLPEQSEGFTRSSMKEMMIQMMNMGEQEN